MQNMDERPLVISITPATVIKTVVILAVCWLLFVIRDIVLIVLTAVVIASAIEPGVANLVRRKIPRILAVILIYLLMFALIVALFFFFLPFVVNDLSLFVSSLPQYAESLTHSAFFMQYGPIVGISGESQDLVSGTLSVLDVRTYFTEPLAALAAVFGGVFSFLLIIVLSFYFAVVDTGVDDFLRIVTPKKHQSYVIGLWKRSQHKIGLWMQGQLLLALIMGVITFLALTIFGVPHAPALAVLTAFAEIIPVFGVIFAGAMSSAIGFAAGGLALGFIVIAIFVIASQFENHLIYPLVVTRVVGIPPLLVILALIIGGQLAGFLGIILSVPIAATLRELARDYESGQLRAHNKAAEQAAT
ncbi:AI-2E family transporter [Candidatus Parcubacteria bacterium]|nr:MAG: AI-2E family transporter [Candidatus Parcubacteria bacterium]